MKKILLNILKCSLLCISFVSLHAQVGIGNTNPTNMLHISLDNSLLDGIAIENLTFKTQILNEINGASFNSIFNNSESLGQYLFQFSGTDRFRMTQEGLYPAVNATDNTVNGALDLGRFNLHYRRVYSQAIHTNDNGVNGGLRINIGSSGGVQADYMFSDFAMFPVLSQVKDLGRNGNFWRNFYFVNAFTPSDRRLKESIEENENVLDLLMKINTYNYVYKADKKKKKHYGFMAQEVLEILPEIVDVASDEKQSLAINYLEVTPLLVEAIKEQQVLISKQSEQIQQLKNRLDALEK